MYNPELTHSREYLASLLKKSGVHFSAVVDLVMPKQKKTVFILRGRTLPARKYDVVSTDPRFWYSLKFGPLIHLGFSTNCTVQNEEAESSKSTLLMLHPLKWVTILSNWELLISCSFLGKVDFKKFNKTYLCIDCVFLAIEVSGSPSKTRIFVEPWIANSYSQSVTFEKEC